MEYSTGKSTIHIYVLCVAPYCTSPIQVLYLTRPLHHQRYHNNPQSTHMSSLLSSALAAGPDPVQPPVQPSTPSLTVVAKHSDSCPYVAYFEGELPEPD